MVKTGQKSEEMAKLIAAWRSSERSKKSFCTEQGINIHTFTYWIEKLESRKRELEEPAVFVRLSPGFEGVALKFPKGATVELRGVPSAVELSILHSLIY